MTRAQEHYSELYRAYALGFHAMADRLISEGEMTFALHIRNEAARQEGLAKLVESVGA